MGFFSGLKSIYKKIDRKVGGYLPGGQTPSQVKQSKSKSSSGSNLRLKGTTTTYTSGSKSKSKSKRRKEPRRDDTIYLGGKTPSTSKKIDTSISGQLERLRSGESFKGPLQPIIQQLGDPASATSNVISTLSLLTGVGAITKGAKGLLNLVKGGANVGAKTGLKGTLTKGLYGTFAGKPAKVAFTDKTYGFAGKIPKPSKVSKLFEAGDKFRKAKITSATRFASNSKTKRLGSSVLAKSGFSGKAIIGIGAAFGTIPWAVHNRGDAIESLTFGMDRAVEQGDLEGYKEQLAAFQEMTSPGLWANMELLVPGLNVVLSTIDKARASKLSVESLTRDMERIQKGEPSQFQKDQLETAGEKNRLFEESQARQREAFAESREGEREKDLELAKEKSRIFLEGDAELRKRELQRRIEDSEFYKQATQGRTTSEKSSLTFGLLSTIEKVLQEITEEDVRG
jgi:hypothetical protein